MASQELSEPGRSEYQSEFLQKNSTVAEPVRSLLDLQSQHYDLNQQFQDEMRRLEQQHYARCQSLFQDRQAVISGKKRDIALYSDVTAQQRGYGASSPALAANGIPHFWLRAMKNNPTIAQWIHDRDEPALSYLRDVRVEFIDKDATGFRIVFDFDKNPFFSNATLTKEFLYKKDSPQDDIFGELLCSKAHGCAISWHPGQNLTDITTTASGQLEYESFFDFFESTSYEDEESDNSEGGDDDSDSGDAVTDDEENRGRPGSHGGRLYVDPEEGSDDSDVEDIERDFDDGSEDNSDDEEQSALDCDFELGDEIKDRLIPFAVHWYTGEALLFEDEDELEDEDGGTVF